MRKPAVVVLGLSGIFALSVATSRMECRDKLSEIERLRQQAAATPLVDIVLAGHITEANAYIVQHRQKNAARDWFHIDDWDRIELLPLPTCTCMPTHK